MIDCGAITAIDYSAARSVRDAYDELSALGVEVLFARVSVYLRADMLRHGLVDAVGTGRVWSTLHGALDSLAQRRASPQAASS